MDITTLETEYKAVFTLPTREAQAHALKLLLVYSIDLIIELYESLSDADKQWISTLFPEDGSALNPANETDAIAIQYIKDNYPDMAVAYQINRQVSAFINTHQFWRELSFASYELLMEAIDDPSYREKIKKGINANNN